MNKKIAITIIAACLLITAGAIYFFSRNTNTDRANFCDYRIVGWDRCNGKIITVSGLNSFSENSEMGIMQHPIDPVSLNQSYLDTAQGQIVLLSNEKINCPENMTITGTLNTRYGPCDAESEGKNAYCGSSISVEEWVCN